MLQTEYTYRKNGFIPLMIKPKLDDREGAQNGWGPIQSRILTGKHQALYVDSITPESLNGIDFNILLVDEVQFFKAKDIEALSEIVDKKNIPVLCYGLKTDVNGNLFEGTAKLLAVADEITEIAHPCKCGEKATHHVRRVDGQVDIAGQPIAVEKGNVTYESVCRKCWKLAVRGGDKVQEKELVPFVEEKGDLEHAIRCTEQAEKRATVSWLKKACSFRVKMLRSQLSRQNNV